MYCDKEAGNLMRGFFDEKTAMILEKMNSNEQLRAQEALMKTLENILQSRNKILRLPGKDKFMRREIEEAEKLKNESGRMAELCSEGRLELVKKRKIEYFIA